MRRYVPSDIAPMTGRPQCQDGSLRAQMSLSAVAVNAPHQFRLFDLHTLPAAPAEPKRRPIWELSGNFHCSIIGTCLTTSELRHVLIKMQLPGAAKESDHDKLARQQKQLRDGIITRDAAIANLNEALGRAIVSARSDDNAPAFPADDAERDAMGHVVGDLRRRLAIEAASRKTLGKRLQQFAAELDLERKQRLVAEQRQRALQEEIQITELSFATPIVDNEPERNQPLDLAGLTILYL
jgi:hypothetical protein